MFTLIIGKNNSGKSSYAESIIADLKGNKRYYIATMIPYGEEGKERVKKHLKMRENLDMETVEDPYLEYLEYIKEDADVLLEDVSNLIANLIFEKGISSRDEIIKLICELRNKSRNLVAVSISGIISEGYDKETASYINILNDVNTELESIADKTVRMGV